MAVWPGFWPRADTRRYTPRRVRTLPRTRENRGKMPGAVTTRPYLDTAMLGRHRRPEENDEPDDGGPPTEEMDALEVDPDEMGEPDDDVREALAADSEGGEAN